MAGAAKEKKAPKGSKEPKAPNAPELDFSAPEYYTNRELSWLQFDRRVLGEAQEKGKPLFERLKFLSIVSSNLDEFFMVRVGSLVDMVEAGASKPDIAGMTPEDQLRALNADIHEMVGEQYECLNRSLLPALRSEGLELVRRHEDLSEAEGKFVDEYFERNVYPVLTPMAVDPSRPFPLIQNRTLNIGALVRPKNAASGAKGRTGAVARENAKSAGVSRRGKSELEFATVQVPGVLPRVVELPEKRPRSGRDWETPRQNPARGRRVILLEEIIERNMGSLFLNYEIVCADPYRITRNGDVTVDEEETEDLLAEIEKTIKLRQRGDVLRLEYAQEMDKRLLSFLTKELKVGESEVYRIDGPLDLTVLMKLYALAGFERLKTPPHTPQIVPELPEGCDIFAQIRGGDILMHHPYQSFTPVVEFIQQASVDPEVLAIKQTLYRVSGNSPIIAALARAAENGKQVTVLVELKARFDEEHNIVWARMLEKAGCHVIYGLMGLKTHSKITLVVRREEDGIRRYVHLGTGNYNDATAKLYTDIGLLTCSEAFGEDATAVFNMISGYSEPRRWNALSVAPLWLKDRMLYLIGREAEHAREHRNARIIAKMNSLSDPEIIRALYEASAAGVRIDLIVRGICCLRVGIPGVSENITVRSIVGEFLEHSRIFYFQNDEHPEIFCGSADWMPRNLDRRVEIVFPVEREELKEELLGILETELADNRQAQVLLPDSREYRKPDRRGRRAVDSQEIFQKEAAKKAKAAAKPKPQETRTFVPRV